MKHLVNYAKAETDGLVGKWVFRGGVTVAKKIMFGGGVTGNDVPCTVVWGRSHAKGVTGNYVLCAGV